MERHAWISASGDDHEKQTIPLMKTSLTLILVGAACALLSSCGTRGTVYVTSEDGEPIAGARLVRCKTPKGCNDPVVTDACGKARLPGCGSHSIEKDYFRPVKGVRTKDEAQHIIMKPGWPN